MDEDENKERLKIQQRFGAHLTRIRKSKGLTQAELARKCFMERSNIARIETGRTNPSLYVMKKLCVGLEIHFEELLRKFE